MVHCAHIIQKDLSCQRHSLSSCDFVASIDSIKDIVLIALWTLLARSILSVLTISVDMLVNKTVFKCTFHGLLKLL